MPLWAAILTAALGSTGLSTVVVAVLQHHWQKKEKEDERIDALMAAQRVSMEERIRYLVQYHMEKGRITLAEKSNLMEMHTCYVGVGGNGNLDTEMAELNKVPVKG